MEEQKLVKRAAVEGDNRRKLITLAPRGKDLYAKMAPLSEAQYKKIESQIGQNNIEALYRLLDKIG